MCLADNFDTQWVEVGTKRSAILDLILTPSDEMTEGVNVGTLEESDHVILEFSIM